MRFGKVGRATGLRSSWSSGAGLKTRRFMRGWYVPRSWFQEFRVKNGRGTPARAARVRDAENEGLHIMATDNSAIQPVDRLELDGYDWFERHAEILACQAAVDPQIVLVGDSITHFWGALPPQPLPHSVNGPRAYASVFGGRRVLNAGFGWDRTQNVLWRLAQAWQVQAWGSSCWRRLSTS